MPELRFACPSCKASLKVADTLTGKKIKCPKCTTVVAVPAAGAAPAAPVARPAAPAAPAKPAAVKPPPRVAPAPKPPPPPAPDPIDELMDMAPDQAPDEAPLEDAGEEAPRRRTGPAPKQGGLDLFTLLGWLLILGYVALVALIYLDILWPRSSFK
jgi:predicted Zn finger-like uncharacterized protein